MARIWATFDSFRTEGGGFWQDKMGRPVANLDFLGALMSWGSWDQYRFYAPDARARAELLAFFDRALPPERRQRIRVRLASRFLDDQRESPADVVHNGDFTYHLPYLLELRRQLEPRHHFAVSGVTHSLDNMKMQLRYLQILLAEPAPQDRILATSHCAVTLLEQAFAVLDEQLTARFGASPPAPPAMALVPLAISEDYDHIADRDTSRAALGLPEHAFVMLSLGRLSLRHKADLAPLLECLQLLEHQGALGDWRLVVAGGGEPAQVELVRGLVRHTGLEHRVVLAPNLSMADKLAHYAAADAFVSLVDNYQETFGLTVLEAQAQGLPVVVSDFNGYRELVEDGRTGFKIPTWRASDPDAFEPLHGLLTTSMTALHRAQRVAIDLPVLAERLTLLARDRERCAQMGRAATEHVRGYRWDRTLAGYERVWEQMRAQVHAVRQGDTAPPDGPPVLVPPVDRWFDHYTTGRVGLDDVLTMTDYGRQRVSLGLTPVIYDDLQAWLPKGLVATLLQRLGKGPVTRRALVEGLLQHQVPRGSVQVAIDLLLKHGYCSGTPSPPPSSR